VGGVLSIGHRLLENLNFAMDAFEQSFVRNFKLVSNLQPQPNRRTGAKIARQP